MATQSEYYSMLTCNGPKQFLLCAVVKTEIFCQDKDSKINCGLKIKVEFLLLDSSVIFVAVKSCYQELHMMLGWSTCMSVV